MTGANKVKGLCISTRCASLDEFVATFYRFCEDDTLFVATLTTRPVGLETPFSILLADRSPALRGFCVVTSSWSTPVNPYRRPGIRIKVVKLTRDGVSVFVRLRARRTEAMADAEPAPRPPPRFEIAGADPRPFEDEPTGFDQAPEPFAMPRTATSDLARAAEIHNTPPDPELPPLPPIAPLPPAKPLSVAEKVTAPTPTTEAPKTNTPPLASPPAKSLSVAGPPLASPPAINAPRDVTKSLAALASLPTSPKPVAPPIIQPKPITTPRIDPAKSLAALAGLGTNPVSPSAVAPSTNTSSEKPIVVAQSTNTSSEKPTVASSTARSVPIVAKSEVTPVADSVKSDAKPVEERTPGSDFVLPANPLMNLTDENLEGFIDCTLYEATAIFTIEEMTPLPGPRPSAIHPTQSAVLQAVQLPAPVAPYSSYPPGTTPPPFGAVIPQTDQLIATAHGMRPPPTGQYFAQSPMPSPYGTTPLPAAQPMPPATQAPFASHTTPPPFGAVADPSASPYPSYTAPLHGPHLEPPQPRGATTPPPFAVHDPANHVYPTHVEPARPTGWTTPPPYAITPQPFLAQREPTPPWSTKPLAVLRSFVRSVSPRALVIAGVATAVILCVVIALAVRGGGSSDPESSEPAIGIRTPTTNKPALKPAPEPAPKPATVVKPPTNRDSTEAEPSSGAAIIGKGPCRLQIVATPADASIQIDGELIGPAPLTFAGPCQKRRVDLSHPRYATATKWVTPTPETQTLDVTLVRPTHSLMVVTQPPGAEVFIDGRRAGTSPTVIQVRGFQSLTITTSKKGYKSASARVYSKVPNDRITLNMPSALFRKR